MTDTTHIPSTTTRTKLYLSIEDFKSHFMGTYIFFLDPNFPMIGLDQLKYQLGLVTICLDRSILL